MSFNNNTQGPVGAIKHNDDRRAAIPTTELAGEESMAAEEMSTEGRYRTFKNEFNRGRDPELYWLGKYQNDSEETQSPDLRIDTRSLYRHEEIRPEMLINQLYSIREDASAKVQMSLFGNELPRIFDDELERVTSYYQHNADWRNRLIQGDSLLVMNSLLQREGMAGKVQMVYIDPPYGIKYGSNWQMKLNNRDVKDNDESLSGEPEMIKAFRDTWELGIHSYLSYLRDRLVLARELLTESGSCFVQISDDNVHLVRNLMDEVFGSENFVSLVPFRKKLMPLGSKTLECMCDFIIWYAKDINNIKYRQLYKRTTPNPSGRWTGVEENGILRRFTKEERADYAYTLKTKNVFGTVSQWAPSYSETNVFDFKFEGKIFHPTQGQCWITSKDKLEKLGRMGRLFVEGDFPRYVLKHEDFPYAKITSPWYDTAPAQDKQYTVQTALLPIQRCMLMCTDPGDLVLDPTCGSGTTAFVAEQWGRRWITIDTSRIALNIAKKRLTTAVYPYYELFDKENGNIRQGFVYKTVPHITLKSLANDLEPDEEILYDQPKEDKKKIRVSGPFTVETLQSFNVVDPADLDSNEVEEMSAFQDRIFSHLKASGIRNGAKNEQAVFYNIEPIANPYLNAKGYYKDAEGKERLAYFHIGPKFGSVSKRAVTEALKEFRPVAQNEGASWLVILGFSFEDNINEKDYNLGTFIVSKVRMHDDLMQEGLLKKDKGAGAFITIGEPDIAIVDNGDGKTVHVEIQGLDIYDPIKDVVKPRSVEDIAYWEIDDDYNGEQFIVRGIRFCGGTKKEFDAWRKGLQSAAPKQTKKKAEATLRLVFNEDLWDTLYDFRSEAIERRPGRRIAVRVISQFGEESTKVLTME